MLLMDVVAFSGTDGQIIYARFEYKTSGCYETVSFTLNLLDQPLIFSPTDMVVCDDISNDGSESFDLSSQTLDILGAQLPENYSVSYYISFEDANWRCRTPSPEGYPHFVRHPHAEAQAPSYTPSFLGSIWPPCLRL